MELQRLSVRAIGVGWEKKVIVKMPAHVWYYWDQWRWGLMIM